MSVSYDGIPQISNRCSACGDVLSKGRLARTWNDMTFCNEYDQASYMLQKGIAKQKPAPSDCRCAYDHYIFKNRPIKVYKGHCFCNFEEFAQWLRENGVGMDCVIGEDVRAL